MNWQIADFETSVGTPAQLPACTLPEIVFSGRSNVGKSSMINKLTARKSLARTSATPGKTATINFYKLDGARLVDLPGYGYAKVSASEKAKWNTLIQGYLDADRDLRLVIQLVDMRHPPSADDRLMLDYLVDSGLPVLVMLTKADKLNKTERAARLAALEQEFAAFEGLQLLPFSAVTGEGADELRDIIADVIE